jgi:hypothetical protein
VAAGAGLDGGLGVHRYDPVTGAQRLALVRPLVEVEDHGGPGGEVRVAGKDHDWYRHGLIGCSAKIRSTEDGEIRRARPRVFAAQSTFSLVVAGPGFEPG